MLFHLTARAFTLKVHSSNVKEKYLDSKFSEWFDKESLGHLSQRGDFS